MKTTMIILCLVFLFLSCNEFKTDTTSNSEENYGYVNWPNKNGAIKCNIEFPAQLISEFNLTLAAVSNGVSFFYKVPFDQNDNIKKGRLQ